MYFTINQKSDPEQFWNPQGDSVAQPQRALAMMTTSVTV
jgi:hypothetical protein